MHRIRIFFLVTVSLSLLSITGCFGPSYNIKGHTPVSPGEAPVAHDENTLIFVALSGGGTRAAAMSWKALETFRKIPYTYQDRNGRAIVSTLADEIDYISGISGGSFAAAAWCIYKDKMDLFRKKFIERNIQRELLKGIFIPPWRGIKLLSPYYDRIDIASELYDNTVFGKKTFNDLPPHPVLWINATNLALGTRFTYDKGYFDLLESDLSRYPIGYACAASSAFPILLSPMTLINYKDPVQLEEDIKYKMAKRNSRRDIEKDYYCKMREFFNNKENRYIHLADGGLVDNQGLQAVIDQFETNGIINKKLNNRENPLKRLIVINVNAGVAPDDTSCRSEKAPGVGSVIKYTMVTSMDRLSAKRWMRIKALCNEVHKAAMELGDSTASFSQLEKPYTIEVSFRNIKDDSVRDKCNKLPTSFYLNEKQLGLVDATVPVLVKEDPEMKRLKESLDHWGGDTLICTVNK